MKGKIDSSGTSLNLPPVLTADQVSEILQIPIKTVYDLGARGKLPRVKLGRTVRFPLRAIMQIVGEEVSEDDNYQGEAPV